MSGFDLQSFLKSVPNAEGNKNEERKNETSSSSSSMMGRQSAAAAAMANVVLRESGSKKQEVPEACGKVLEGDEVYDVDLETEGRMKPQLPVSPITMYNSEGKVGGRIIAVNDSYICYGLKGGQIRVLNPKTGVRTLLRGHESPVSDMAFFSKKMDVFGSVSMDGKLFIRRLKESDSSGDAADIEDEVLLSLQISAGKRHIEPLFCWHPSLPDGFACSVANQVFVCSISACILGNGKSKDIRCNLEETPPKGIAVLPASDDTVSALQFSRQGLLLAIGSVDGGVKVWSMPGAGSDSSSTKLLGTFKPFGREAVGSIHWMEDSSGGETLMTGNSSNSDLRLWELVGGQYKCSQTLKLVSSRYGLDAFANHLTVVTEFNLILVVNAKRSCLYAIHYCEGKKGGLCFGYLTEYSIAQPILSFATHVADVGAQREAAEVHVFAVQPKAIQQYVLDARLCSPSKDAQEEGAVVEENEPKVGLQTAGSQVLDEDRGYESPSDPSEGNEPPRLLTPSQIMQLAGSGSKVPKDRDPIVEDKEQATREANVHAEGGQGFSQESAAVSMSASAMTVKADSDEAPKVRLLVRPTAHQAPSPDQRLKQLEEEISRLKSDTTVAVANEGRRLEQAIVKALKASVQESRAFEKKRMEKLVMAMSQSIHQDLPKQLAGAMSAEMDGFVEKVVHAVNSSVAGSLETSTTKVVQSKLPGALKGTLTEALKSNFQTSIIPSFEAAVREMFSQISAALDNGLQQRVNAGTEVAQLSDLLTQASHLTESLRLEITEGQRKLMAMAADERNRALKAARESVYREGQPGMRDGSGLRGTSLEQLEARLDPTIELKALVEAGKFEESFNKVLSLGNVETVVWLCKQVDANAIFNVSPPLLSQGVLLSLMQQLSTELQRDASVKLAWIQNTALALDPQDPILSIHMRPILQSTFVALNNRLRTAGPGEAGQIKLVIHLMNSLLTACK